MSEVVGRKLCSKCLEPKPWAEFYESSSSADGLGSWCKACEKLYQRERYAETSRSNKIAYQLNYTRGRGRIKHLLRRARERAEAKGLEFCLTEEDIFIPETCPILGIALVVSDGKPGDASPSLDRIDRTKGYIPGNVQVISHRANTMKSSATPDQLLMFAAWVNKVYGGDSL